MPIIICLLSAVSVVHVCEAQPVTEEQINTFLSQFNKADIARKKRPYLVPEGPQVFGENVKVVYYGDNGKIHSIRAYYHPITLPIDTTTQDAAEKFLREHAEQIGITPDLSDLVLRRPPLIEEAPNFVYNQYYEGYQVRNGIGRAGLGVKFRSHNQLAKFSSSLVLITDPRPISFAIDREAALQLMWGKFCMLPECNEENSFTKLRQFVRVEEGVPYGTWEVAAGGFQGMSSRTWTAWIDGGTGAFVTAFKNELLH